MEYGLGTWSTQGLPEINENSFTVRLVLSVVVTFPNAKGTQDFAIPGCNPSNAVAFILPIEAPTSNDRQFETEMLNGIARVYNYTRTFEASKTSAGSMRLFVVRFR